MRLLLQQTVFIDGQHATILCQGFVEDAAPVMTQMESSQFLGIVAGGQSRFCFPQRGGYLSYWLADFNCQT